MSADDSGRFRKPANGNGTDGLWTIVARWLTQQTPITVLTFVQISMFAYAFWWAMTKGVPDHLKSIKEGYVELETKHREERAEDRTSRVEARKDFVEAIKQNSQVLKDIEEKHAASQQRMWEIHRELKTAVGNVEREQQETNTILRDIKKGGP